MLETELANPVMDWLESRGFTPYGEVPWYNRAIDVVGLCGDYVWAVELKLSLSRQVIAQAHLNQLTVHRSWCAVASRPRTHEKRLREGLGLLVVSGGTVEVLVEAQLRTEITSEDRCRRIRGACAYKSPRGEAGMPTMRGIGPAQFVFDAVQKFIADNPRATWGQIFDCVPNHYAHARSMQGAMRVVRDVRAARERRLESQRT